MSVFLLTSQRNAMRALASQGIFATDCHAQVCSIIAQHLSPAHAALIAEPQHDPGQQRIDWYAGVNGTATPVSALPAEEAERLRARAGELARDILHLSEQWGKDAQSREALAGQMLALVLQHPHEDDLWSVDGQPVLVNWGFAPGAVGAMPQDLSRMGGAIPVAAAVAPVAAAAVPVAAAGSGCIGWLLPLLLALLLLWLLLAALGILPSPLPASCLKPAADPRLDQATQAAEKQRNELEELLRQLREKALLCKPPQPKPEPKPEPPKPDPEVVTPQLVPDKPIEPAPEPKPEPKPKPQPKPEPKPEPKPKPRKNEDLNIPADAAKKNDLSFLEGCWQSDTGLFSHPSNTPIIAEYCFDKKGQGRRFVREENGQVCSGPATAKFEGNRLVWRAGTAPCPKGNQYVPQQVQCTGNDKSTRCQGVEQSKRNLRWKADFKRK